MIEEVEFKNWGDLNFDERAEVLEAFQNTEEALELREQYKDKTFVEAKKIVDKGVKDYYEDNAEKFGFGRSKTLTLDKIPPQYMLVDRCTKLVFAPITAFAFVLGVVFYLSANMGMAVGLAGIGITSLLLTIVFSVTKIALKEFERGK